METKHCVFMGTPQIAADVLSGMLEAGMTVDLVVTQPDRKVGRKQKIVYSPVKEVALAHDIEVFQPLRIKEDYAPLLDRNIDLIVTCAYGQIVPDVVLDHPTYGCVNLHGSLLPKYRGGAPIQRAIWNGDTQTGMSLMKMVTAMDAGPVLAVATLPITEQDNSTSIFNKMGPLAAQLLIDHFEEICSPQAQYIEQDETQVTFAPVITKQEEHLNLEQNDRSILNQIRALAFTPGGYVLLKNKKFKILEACYQKQNVQTFGEILGFVDNGYAIALHEGVLIVKQCQMEGKPQMDAKSFYNGQGRNLVGQIIE